MLAVGGVLVVPGLVHPRSASADPAPKTVGKARTRVQHLQQQAEKAGQQYAGLQVKLRQSKEHLNRQRADLATQRQRVNSAQKQASKVALAQYKDRGMGAKARLFTADDTSGFLNRLATVDKVGKNQNAILQNYQVEQANVSDLEQSRRAAVANLKRTREQLSGAHDKADDKLDEDTEAEFEIGCEEQLVRRVEGELRRFRQGCSRIGIRQETDR